MRLSVLSPINPRDYQPKNSLTLSDLSVFYFYLHLDCSKRKKYFQKKSPPSRRLRVSHDMAVFMSLFFYISNKNTVNCCINKKFIDKCLVKRVCSKSRGVLASFNDWRKPPIPSYRTQISRQSKGIWKGVCDFFFWASGMNSIAWFLSTNT